MAKITNISAKQLKIDKANSLMVGAIATASFLIVFTIFAGKALISQMSFQNRVIKEKSKAAKQLKNNLDASNSLVSSYKNFVDVPENVLGGNPKGSGPKDGDNAKIVLDALPSKYDFPALTASLEAILKNGGFRIDGITGTDDELNQQDSTSPTPQLIEIPFQISASGNYGSMKNLIGILGQSIRPIQIQTIEFSGSDNGIQATVSAKTFYQPEKSLSVRTKEVK